MSYRSVGHHRRGAMSHRHVEQPSGVRVLSDPGEIEFLAGQAARSDYRQAARLATRAQRFRTLAKELASSSWERDEP